MLRIFHATILFNLAKIGSSEEPKKAHMDMTMCKGITIEVGKPDYRARIITPKKFQMQYPKFGGKYDSLIDWCEHSLQDYDAWELIHDVRDAPDKPLIIYEERQAKDCHWQKNKEGVIIPDKNAFRFLNTMIIGEPLDITGWSADQINLELQSKKLKKTADNDRLLLEDPPKRLPVGAELRAIEEARQSVKSEVR